MACMQGQFASVWWWQVLDGSYSLITEFLLCRGCNWKTFLDLFVFVCPTYRKLNTLYMWAIHGMMACTALLQEPLQRDFIVLWSTGTLFNMSFALPAFLQTGKPNKYRSGNLEYTSKVWTLSSVRIFKLESKFISWHISWLCFYLIKKKLCTSGNYNLYLWLWWENANEAVNFVISILLSSHLL